MCSSFSRQVNSAADEHRAAGISYVIITCAMPRAVAKSNYYSKKYDVMSLSALGAALIIAEAALLQPFLPLPRYRSEQNKIKAIKAQMRTAILQMASWARHREL